MRNRNKPPFLGEPRENAPTENMNERTKRMSAVGVIKEPVESVTSSDDEHEGSDRDRVGVNQFNNYEGWSME